MSRVLLRLCELCESSLEEIFPNLTRDEMSVLRCGLVQYVKIEAERITSSIEGKYLTYEMPDIIEDKEASEAVSDSLKILTSRERRIIELRYGLSDGNAYTLDQVGRILNVTGARVRQIESRAIRKLQKPEIARELVEFVD